jgi:hypothetical protein
MKHTEILHWLEVMNERQARNEFNVADIPVSVLLELHRRRFTVGNVITEEGIKFLEKNKVELS